MDTMRLMSAAALAAVITGAAPGEPQAASGPLPAASAAIVSCGDAKISGTAFLFEEPSAEGIKTVQVVLQVQGLPPGAHAVHIHETGACSPCAAAGGHFDPGPSGNPSPDGNHPFHSGDLINIQAGGDGAGTLATATTRVTLSPGPLSLFDKDGSALIIHERPDTYCPGGEVAGCAGGARIACGIIKPRPLD
jgi:Cu-Zn family superoxide dismutase